MCDITSFRVAISLFHCSLFKKLPGQEGQFSYFWSICEIHFVESAVPHRRAHNNKWNLL